MSVTVNLACPPLEFPRCKLSCSSIIYYVHLQQPLELITTPVWLSNETSAFVFPTSVCVFTQGYDQWGQSWPMWSVHCHHENLQIHSFPQHCSEIVCNIEAAMRNMSILGFFFFPWVRSREQLSAAQWTGERNCWATYLNTVTKTLQVLAGVSAKKNIKITTGGFTELASWKDGKMTHLFHIYSGQNALFCEKANLCLLSIFVFHHLWLDIF